MDALERRLARLEQIQGNIDQTAPLLITCVGAEQHFGDFAVECAGDEMVLTRTPDEPWETFNARLNQLAVEQQRSPLSIIFFFPTTTDQEAEN